MKFFFPDSLDLVDPLYDFEQEVLSKSRVRQRREAYAHEILGYAPYDGLLISMAITGFHLRVRPGKQTGRYTSGMRARLLYTGAHRFFRLDNLRGSRVETMGDSGAYAYAFEEAPPVSVDDVLDFYEMAEFDYGIAPDLIIPGTARARGGTVPDVWQKRRQASLDLAADFLQAVHGRRSPITSLGVAQGWNPISYAEAVSELERVGYDYIALGGLAPLPTSDILACVEAAAAACASTTRLHVLGVGRSDLLRPFLRLGIASLDSTMPLRQAFKDDKHNYHTLEHNYLALRVPDSENNARLIRLVKEGRLQREQVRRLEQEALDALRCYDRETAGLDEALEAVAAYEVLYNGRDHTSYYQRLLEDQPWKACPCPICRHLGVEVVLFRGAERNKRRGFHNLYVFHERLRRVLANELSSSEANIAPLR